MNPEPCWNPISRSHNTDLTSAWKGLTPKKASPHSHKDLEGELSAISRNLWKIFDLRSLTFWLFHKKIFPCARCKACQWYWLEWTCDFILYIDFLTNQCALYICQITYEIASCICDLIQLCGWLCTRTWSVRLHIAVTTHDNHHPSWNSQGTVLRLHVLVPAVSNGWFT